MKFSTLLLPVLFLAITACSNAPRMERSQLEAPSDADIAGNYTLIEETVTSRPLDESPIKGARLELNADGTLKLLNFPIVLRSGGIHGIHHQITETGRWLVVSRREGYGVILVRGNGDRLHSDVVEGGNPSDLMIYYGPKGNGYFTKWRKS